MTCTVSPACMHIPSGDEVCSAACFQPLAVHACRARRGPLAGSAACACSSYWSETTGMWVRWYGHRAATAGRHEGAKNMRRMHTLQHDSKRLQASMCR